MRKDSGDPTVDDLKKQLKIVTERSAMLEVKNNELQDTILHINHDTNATVAQLRNANNNIKTLERQNQELSLSYETISKRLQEVNTAFEDKLKKEKTGYEQKLKKIGKRLEDSESYNVEIAKKLKEKSLEIKRLSQQNAELAKYAVNDTNTNATVLELSHELESLRTKNLSLKNELEQIQQNSMERSKRDEDGSNTNKLLYGSVSSLEDDLYMVQGGLDVGRGGGASLGDDLHMAQDDTIKELELKLEKLEIALKASDARVKKLNEQLSKNDLNSEFQSKGNLKPDETNVCGDSHLLGERRQVSRLPWVISLTVSQYLIYQSLFFYEYLSAQQIVGFLQGTQIYILLQETLKVTVSTQAISIALDITAALAFLASSAIVVNIAEAVFCGQVVQDVAENVGYEPGSRGSNIM